MVEELVPRNDTGEHVGFKIHNRPLSSSRRPFRISPEVFTQNPLLRALTEVLFVETRRCQDSVSDQQTQYV